MSIQVSPQLNNLLFVLIGEKMLQADEDKAYANGKPYGRLSRRVRELSDLIEQTAGGIGRSLPPQVGNQYVRAMHLFLDNGGSNYLKDFSDQLDDLEKARTQSSMDIMEAKWQIIAELVRLLIELAVIMALAAFTGGSAAGQAAVAKARSRVAILTLLDWLTKRTHLLPTLTEAIEEAFMTFSVRLAMMLGAPKGRRPDGFNWSQIVQDGVFGAFTGLFHGVLNDIANGLKNHYKNLWDSRNNPFKDIDGNGSKFDDKFDDDLLNGAPNPRPKPDPEPAPSPGPTPTPGPGPGVGVGDRFRHEIGQDIQSFLTEGGAEALAELATAAIFHFPTDGLMTFLGGGLSAVSERHLGQGAAAFGGKFNISKPPAVNLSIPPDTARDDTSAADDTSPSGDGGRGTGAPGPGPAPGPVTPASGGDHDGPDGTDRPPTQSPDLDADLTGGGINGNGPLDAGLTGLGPTGLDGLDGLDVKSNIPDISNVPADGTAPRPGGIRTQSPATDTPASSTPDKGTTAGNTTVADENAVADGDTPAGAATPAGGSTDTGGNTTPDKNPTPGSGNPVPGKSPTPGSGSPVPGKSPTATSGSPRPGSTASQPQGAGDTQDADTTPQAPQTPQQPSPEDSAADATTTPDDATTPDGAANGTAPGTAAQAPPTMSTTGDAPTPVSTVQQQPHGTDTTDTTGNSDTTDATGLPEPVATTGDDRLAPGPDTHTGTGTGTGTGTIVSLDDGQRRFIAAQVSAADVPEDLPGPAPDAPVTVQDLDRAGVPLPSEQRVRSVLSGAPLSLTFGDLPVVDRVKVLMTRPGPWPASLDAVAADATRRLWQDAHADFTRTVPAGADSPGARRDWDAAVGLVLPTQSHPVLADPRYADEPYRDAVRQVADLLSDGGGLDAAAGLADQLRRGLGLPDRTDEELTRTVGSPGPVPTTGTAGTPAPVTTVTASAVPTDLALTPVADTPVPKSPTSSLGSAAMDLATPEPEDQHSVHAAEHGPGPVPGPSSSRRPDPVHSAEITRVFGAGITGTPLHASLLDAAARLDALRQAGHGPALDPGPLDLDAVARQVLLLDPGTPVTHDHHGDLFRIALDPAMEQASGLAALAAFGLALQGGLAAPNALTGQDGTPYGRAWSGAPGAGLGLDIDTDATTVRVRLPDGREEESAPRPAPWGPRAGQPRPYVVLASGNSHAVLVRTKDGTRVSAPPAVLAELLASDPVLSSLPPEVPVLLVVPYAGGRQLELPRALADRLGREVWSTSGQPVLGRRDGTARVPLSLQDRPGVPRGDWIRSRPGEVVAEDRGDVPQWERRVISHTIVADENGNPQLGRMAFNPSELAGVREFRARNVHRITSLAQRHPGALGVTSRTPLTVGAGPDEQVYHLIMHASPHTVSVPQEDGSTYHASGEELTRWLSRRPSVRRLRDQDWIYLDACWTGGSYQRGARAGANLAARPQPAADPLADVPTAQTVANGTRKRVRAVDRPAGHHNDPGDTSRFWLEAYTDARGRGGQVREFRPEPSDGELAAHARTAGLHTGPGPVSAETAARTLRLVRALRLALGPGVDDDPSYGDLLRGIGALETMRQADPALLGTGPFTMDLFQRVAFADRRDHGGGPGPVDATAYRNLLARAAAAPAGTPLSRFARVPHLVGVAQLTRNLKDLPATTRSVLRLDAAEPVGEAELSRLYWAQVKALEWLNGLPDVAGTAARVLHLPAPDAGRRAELGRLATRAIAVGRDPADPAELAAFHLEELGAFAPESLLPGTDGRPAGRNWIAPVPGTPLDGSVLGTITSQPDGTRRHTGTQAAPWAGPDRHPAYVVAAADAGPGRVGITLPGGRRLAVPYAEFAELVARDPELTGRDLWKTDVVLAVPRAGAAALPQGGVPQPRPLPLWVASATARSVWAPGGAAGLGRQGNAEPLTVGADPGAAWTRTHPRDLFLAQPPASAPAPAPAVPAQPTVSTTALASDAGPTATLTPTAADGDSAAGTDQRGTTAPTAATDRPTTTTPTTTTNRPTTTTPTTRGRTSRAVPRSALATIPEDGPPPEPPHRPAPLGPPAPPARPRGVNRLGWVGRDLDLRRPPRVDRDLPPAPVDGGGPVRFSDGSRLPAYMGGVAALYPELPPELLRRSYALGQSDSVLRGTDQVAAEITSRLDRAGVRPGAPDKRWGRSGRSLEEDVRRRLRERPQGFFGDGQQFTYRTVNGRTRVVRVTARPYGRWDRFAFGFANPVKVDTMARTTTTTGRTAVNSTSTSLVPTVPLGPVKLKYTLWGRVFFRKNWTKQVQYGLQDQTMNQNETRTTDGSHAHLDDVWYDVEVTDRLGRPVDAADRSLAVGSRGGVVFGFAVRAGLMARIADSLTRDKPPADRLPQRMDLGGRPAYRLVTTEAFGPMAHVRDWTLQQLGVTSDSLAGAQLTDFFSTDGFQRMSRVQNAGRTTTPPLFRDSSGAGPLGVFTVEVRSGEARLISETTAAELRDITQATVRNERVVTRSKSTEAGGALGPSFQFFGTGHGAFDLRVLLGGNVRYGSSRGRAGSTGGTGAVKAAGQAKGDPTGLYFVQKTVTVTAPPGTRAPLPDLHGDGDTRPGRPRENAAGGRSAAPRVQTFHTWAVERMTRTEARRLAGLDRGLSRDTEPAVPPYLAADRPPTLGMARPEEFTFDDGAFTRTVGGTERTFPEHFAEQVLAQVARAYPDLVAPLAELDPGSSRWRGPDHFQIVLNNTLEVLNTLNHHGMAGNLEAMMTTGLRIELVDSGRIGRGLRYVWIDAELTGRRYEGRQKDLRLRFSAPGSENLGGRQSGGRGLHGGLEGLLSLRDSHTDDIGGPSQAGTGSAGVRYGARSDSDSAYGPSVTHEAMAIGTKGADLYSYQLTLTARRGGFWRFRSLLRGVLFLNLLGTQPFVFRERETGLLGGPGTAPAVAAPATAAPDAVPPGAAVVGRVLLSIPVEHVPTRGAGRVPGPLHGVPLPVPRRSARDLALTTRTLLDQAARRRTPDHHKHPFLTLTVTSHPGLADAAEQVLEEASGGSWLLTQQGAPAHDAAMRAFQSQYLTANFDQTSAATGWRASGLWAKAPYLDRSSVLAHRTRVVPGSLTALTGPVSVDTETTLGGAVQTAGRNSRTSTLFVGGQLVFLKSHATGPGVTGSYGLVASPYRLDRSRARQVSRIALAEINRKDFNRQVLVTGDVQHEIAAASSTVGRGAIGRRYLPRWLAGAAGRRVLVSDGWTAHIPEKSAYRLGLLSDRWGDVPRYTRRTWSPQPWLLDNPFGGFAVNALNTAPVLRDFDRRLRPLGLSRTDRDTVHRLVSDRVVRALGKEMTGSGVSVPAEIGRWGSDTVRMWVGDRQVAVRAELIPVKVPRSTVSDGDGPGFAGLGHSVELEEHRQAVETVADTRGRASGASVGTTVTEAIHTGNEVARAAGPSYSEVGATQQSVSLTRSDGSVRIATATTTQAHGEYVTRYRLRLSLDITDTGTPEGADGTDGSAVDGTGRGARGGPFGALGRRTGRWWRRVTGRSRLTVDAEGDVGELIEHYPLSLMRPDPVPASPGPADGGEPAPDPLAPPDLPPHGAPRKVAVPRTMGAGGWRDVRHPGDGSTKPFTLPEDGFKVRRIVGLERLRDANTLALASAYDTGLNLPERGTPSAELLARASDTPLTRAGTGAAQNLRDGTSNGALSAFYDHTLDADGYRIPGLTDRGFLGGADGDLAMYSRPDLGRAQLLAVADGMKHEAPKRDTQGGGMSVARVGTTESSLGGGPLTSSPSTGTNQMGATGPGDSATDSDALAQQGDRLGSVTVKPNTTRSFLFAIPTTWLSVAGVHHHVRDSRVARAVRSPFGNPQRGPQAMETDTTVLAWVREDVARDLGLIDDTGFPPKVAKAWDAVTRADKEWTAADKKYWDRRRDEGPAREAALAGAESTLAALAARDVDGLPEIAAARTALRRVTDEIASAEPEHDGWARLQDEQREKAAARLDDLLRAAAGEVSAARAARDTARRRLDELGEELRELRATAEALADEYARVREGADRLTRWHQLHATEAGRRALGGTPEPSEVTFTPPASDGKKDRKDGKGGDRAKDDGARKDDGKEHDAKKDDTKRSGAKDGPEGDDGEEKVGGDGDGPRERPAHAGPPWRPGDPDAAVTFDAASDHRTLTATGLDGRTRTYDLRRPDGDGNGFYAALSHALGGGQPDRLASRVAASRELPADAPLDAAATFSVRELELRAGLAGPRNAAKRAAVEAAGGRLPDAVRDALTPVQRERLVRLHLRQGRRWDGATADLAASTTARTLGVNLTVVGEDGSHRRFLAGPGVSRPPEVTLYRQGDSYLAALPRPLGPAPGRPPVLPEASRPAPPEALPATSREPSPPPPPERTRPVPAEQTRPAPPKASSSAPAPGGAGTVTGTGAGAVPRAPRTGPRVTAGDRSFVLREVPADGDCLMHAVLGGLASQAPASPAAGLTVRQLRDRLVRWYTGAPAAAELRAQHARRDPLETLVQDLFPDLDSLLGILGETRPPDLTARQRDRVDAQVAQAVRRRRLLALAGREEDRALLADLPGSTVRAVLPALTPEEVAASADRRLEQRLVAREQTDTLRTRLVDVLRTPGPDPAADALWRRVRTGPLGQVGERGMPYGREEFLALGHDALVARALAAPDLWHTPFYDEVPLLVARALGVDLVVVQPDGTGGFGTRSLDPEATGPALHVHYNGTDHYRSLDPDGTPPRPSPATPSPATPAPAPPVPPQAPPAPRPDQGDRDWLAELARRHGASEAYVRRLTEGLSAPLLARLRAQDLERDGDFGDPVQPKRVKDEERDDRGDVRVNPLWTPLEEIDPDLLLTGDRDAVWLYTVTRDGRVLVGSEEPSAVLSDDQTDALLAGLRTRRPGLTAERLKAELDGLGHTGIAAEFGGDGRTRPGASRVSGEFRWSHALRSWTVNDKSGRYMSKSVRPGVAPETAAGWLDNVAALFTERLGVHVRPDQVKSAAPPVAAEPAAGSASVPAAPAAALTLIRPSGTADWLPQALAAAVRDRAADRLDRPGLGALLAGPDAGDALHRWVEFRLAAPDAAARVPARLSGTGWAGAHTTLTLGELEAVGVTLPEDQHAFAALTGGLPTAEVTLGPAQRYRLLRLWGEAEGLVTVTEVAVAVAAADLELGIALVGPDGDEIRYGPSSPGGASGATTDPAVTGR